MEKLVRAAVDEFMLEGGKGSGRYQVGSGKHPDAHAKWAEADLEATKAEIELDHIPSSDYDRRDAAHEKVIAAHKRARSLTKDKAQQAEHDRQIKKHTQWIEGNKTSRQVDAARKERMDKEAKLTPEEKKKQKELATMVATALGGRVSRVRSG